MEVTNLAQEREIRLKREKEKVKVRTMVRRRVKEVKRTSFVSTSGTHSSLARALTEDKLATSVTT